jgi:hypothetical protein
MKCGDDWKGDQYLYRDRGVLALVGPMGREGSGWGRFRVGELVWWRKYKRSGQVLSSYCVLRSWINYFIM